MKMSAVFSPIIASAMMGLSACTYTVSPQTPQGTHGPIIKPEPPSAPSAPRSKPKFVPDANPRVDGYEELISTVNTIADHVMGYWWEEYDLPLNVPMIPHPDVKCGNYTDPLAVYCDDSSSGGVIKWSPAAFADVLSNGGDPGGDLAITLVVAHEYAHAVQGLGKGGFSEDAAHAQAWCVAGAYANDVRGAGPRMNPEWDNAISALGRNLDNEQRSLLRKNLDKGALSKGTIPRCEP